MVPGPRPPLLLLALLGTLTLPSAAQPQARAAATDTGRTALLTRADLGRIRGDSRASVWVVVMSDFQCPFCRSWHDETAPLIEREYVATGKVRLAYLNYIAVSSHRNAPAAHEAAMCAAEQGRFFPMADALFEGQPQWKGRTDAPLFFDSLAVRLSLSLTRFRACIREGAARPLIAADQARVERLPVNGTPAFLIGGKLLIGAQPFTAFKLAIDDALARASVPPA